MYGSQYFLLFSNNENSTEHYTVTEKLKVSFPEKSVEPESEEESQMAVLRDKKNDGIEGLCSSTIQSKE